MTKFSYGDKILVTDAAGRIHKRRALSGVMMGEDFPVVWACRAEEFEEATRSGIAPSGVPWPAGDVARAEAMP
jgi:hypothetical protein